MAETKVIQTGVYFYANTKGQVCQWSKQFDGYCYKHEAKERKQ